MSTFWIVWACVTTQFRNASFKFIWFYFIFTSFARKTWGFLANMRVIPCQMNHWVSGDPLRFCSYSYYICSSIGRMNTQKKSVANSFRFWKYSSSKICPDPPLFGFRASRHWFIWSLTCIYSSLQQDTKVKIATWANFQPYFKNLKSKTLYLA